MEPRRVDGSSGGLRRRILVNLVLDGAERRTRQRAELDGNAAEPADESARRALLQIDDLAEFRWAVAQLPPRQRPPAAVRCAISWSGPRVCPIPRSSRLWAAGCHRESPSGHFTINCCGNKDRRGQRQQFKYCALMTPPFPGMREAMTMSPMPGARIASQASEPPAQLADAYVEEEVADVEGKARAAEVMNDKRGQNNEDDRH